MLELIHNNFLALAAAVGALAVLLPKSASSVNGALSVLSIASTKTRTPGATDEKSDKMHEHFRELIKLARKAKNQQLVDTLVRAYQQFVAIPKKGSAE